MEDLEKWERLRLCKYLTILKTTFKVVKAVSSLKQLGKICSIAQMVVQNCNTQLASGLMNATMAVE